MPLKKALQFGWHIPRNLLIGLVRFYQKTLSPDHSAWGRQISPGGYCQYTPSCSEYACLALERHGFIRGILKGLWRVCRCNPWSTGKADLP